MDVQRNEETGGKDHSSIPRSRKALWSRLELLLSKTSSRGFGRLDDRELEELGRLYRAAATHLSLLQAFGASVREREGLNRLVARAHGVIYARPRRGWNLKFFLFSFLAFPETVRRLARYHALAAILLLVGMAYGYLGSQRDPEWALEVVPAGDERTPFATREELLATLHAGRPDSSAAPEAAEDVERGPREAEARRPKYRTAMKSAFAALLWRHNTTIALQAFFFGLLGGIPTVLALLFNGSMLGVYSHTFHAHGLAYEWWAWILPHGVTELLAVAILSGGGLFLGHRVLVPGMKSRRQALAETRGDALRLLLFAFPMLLLAALIESFVRQSGLSDPGRYVFAALSALFWVLYLTLGGIPRKTVERFAAARTLAERAVPLPEEEEVLGLLPVRRLP